VSQFFNPSASGGKIFFENGLFGLAAAFRTRKPGIGCLCPTTPTASGLLIGLPGLIGRANSKSKKGV